MADTTEERREFMLRIPPDLLARVDAYTTKNVSQYATPSRNATICALLERGLKDAERSRGGK